MRRLAALAAAFFLLPASGAAAATTVVSLGGGQLTLSGSAGDDTVTVATAGTGVKVNDPAGVTVPVGVPCSPAAATNVTVTCPDPALVPAVSGVNAISASLGDGNDRF